MLIAQNNNKYVSFPSVLIRDLIGSSCIVARFASLITRDRSIRRLGYEHCVGHESDFCVMMLIAVLNFPHRFGVTFYRVFWHKLFYKEARRPLLATTIDFHFAAETDRFSCRKMAY